MSAEFESIADALEVLENFGHRWWRPGAHRGDRSSRIERHVAAPRPSDQIERSAAEVLPGATSNHAKYVRREPYWWSPSYFGATPL